MQSHFIQNINMIINTFSVCGYKYIFSMGGVPCTVHVRRETLMQLGSFLKLEQVLYLLTE